MAADPSAVVLRPGDRLTIQQIARLLPLSTTLHGDEIVITRTVRFREMKISPRIRKRSSIALSPES